MEFEKTKIERDYFVIQKVKSCINSKIAETNYNL